jgi:hypothetical protein
MKEVSVPTFIKALRFVGAVTSFFIRHFHINQRAAEKRAAHHRSHQKAAVGQINHAKHQRRKNIPDLRKRNAPYARRRIHPGNTRRPVLRAVRPDKKVVYVSCNPSTLAKDIAVLNPEYKVEFMQPVDMFPQTVHAEVVTELVLKVNK